MAQVAPPRRGDRRTLFRLSLVELAPGVQVVEVEYGVEDEEVAPVRLAAPDRVVGEEDDVAALNRHVNDRRVLGQLAALVEQAGDEQIARLAVAQHDARAHRGRDDVRIVARLLFAQGQSFPDFRARLFGYLGGRSSLHNVRVARGAASRLALRLAAAAPPAPSAPRARHA